MTLFTSFFSSWLLDIWLCSSGHAEKTALKDFVSKYQGHSECCLSAKIYVGTIRCSLALCVSVWNDKHYQDIVLKA